MKNILFFLCCLGMFNVLPVQASCLNQINTLETEFQKCQVVYSENATTADLNNAVYDVVDCRIKVADKIFDIYYKQSNEVSKKKFKEFISFIYDYARHLTLESDYAQKYYTGTMYNSIAISHAEDIIQKVVASYLKQMRFECKDSLDD